MVFYCESLKLKKGNNEVSFCCMVSVEWITGIDMLNLNSIIYHGIRKTILSEDSL